MTYAVIIMFAVAFAFVVIGVFFLVRLRSRATSQARYAHGMVGTMAAALGLILVIFASAQWSWSVAP